VISESTAVSNFPDPEYDYTIVSGANFAVYYIGCCDEELNWIQEITEYSPDPGSVPRFDADPDSPYFPFYYYPPEGTSNPNGIINNHMSDYSADSGYPVTCPQ